MDQTKLDGMFAEDVSNENKEHKEHKEHQAAAISGANEAHPLKDLGLVIAAGGDGIAIW